MIPIKEDKARPDERTATVGKDDSGSERVRREERPDSRNPAARAAVRILRAWDREAVRMWRICGEGALAEGFNYVIDEQASFLFVFICNHTMGSNWNLTRRD